MGFFEKLKNGLKKTKDSMMGRIESLLHSFNKIDEDLFEELEETLILCDIGVTTSEKICDKLRQKVKQEGVKEPEKIKDMLKAYYPVLYLTSYEYDRTKQKIEGIVNILRSENKNLRLFNWNCVDGLRLIDGVTQSPVQNKDGEEIIEPEETLKYILNDRESSKDIFVLEDFNNYIEEENVKFYIRSIAEKARHTNSHAIVLSAVYKLPVELEKYVLIRFETLP